MKKIINSLVICVLLVVGIMFSCISIVKADIQYNELKLDDVYQSGTIYQSDEIDYYTVTIPTAGWLYVTYQGFDIGQSYVQVMDIDMSYSYEIKRLYSSSNESPGTIDMVLAMEPGTYVLKVYPYKRNVGNYRIKASFEAVNNNEVESNNSFQTAMQIYEGNFIKGFISIDDELDFYKLIINEEKTVIIDFKPSYSYASFEVWDSNYICINRKSIRKASEDNPATYTYEATLKPGVYFVKVSSYKKYNGEYTLKYEYKNYVGQIGISGKRKITAGKKLALSANVIPANATDKSIEWTSGNTSIATVDDTGVVTAKCAGKVKITASALDGSNVSKTVTIIIKPEKMSKPSAYVNYGRNIRIGWYSVSGASGYQIQYGLKKSTSGAKYLKAGRNTYYKYLTLRRKTYYIRVRAYYKTGKKVYYGNWSSYKKIKIK